MFGGTATELTPKKIGEVGLITADFTSSMAASETISTRSCTATVYTGTDGNPANIISGAATHSGKIVSQLITGGVLGVIYQLLFQVTTSLGQTLQQTKLLAVVPGST